MRKQKNGVGDGRLRAATILQVAHVHVKSTIPRTCDLATAQDAPPAFASFSVLLPSTSRPSRIPISWYELSPSNGGILYDLRFLVIRPFSQFLSLTFVMGGFDFVRGLAVPERCLCFVTPHVRPLCGSPRAPFGHFSESTFMALKSGLGQA